MRFFVLAIVTSSVLGVEYNASVDYIKQVWYGDKLAAMDHGNTKNCTGNINRTILLRVPKDQYTTTNSKLWGSDMQGACINTDADFKMHFGATQTMSFMFSRVTATPGMVTPVQFAAVNCQGAGVIQDSAWKTGATANSTACGQKKQNTTECGVALTGGNADGAANGAAGWDIKGTFFVGTRSLAIQLQGPFNSEFCTSLTADNVNSFPIVIPLASHTANTAADSEVAVSDSGLCYDYGFAGNAAASPAVTADVYLWRASLTATKGKMMLEYSDGTASDFVSRASCVNGTTNYHRIYYTLGVRGNFEMCTRAKDPSDNDISSWYKVLPHWESIGDGLNLVDYETSCPTCTEASPASGLYVSTLMAVVIALIGMLM